MKSLPDILSRLERQASKYRYPYEMEDDLRAIAIAEHKYEADIQVGHTWYTLIFIGSFKNERAMACYEELKGLAAVKDLHLENELITTPFFKLERKYNYEESTKK